MKNRSARIMLIGVIFLFLAEYGDAAFAEVNINIGIGVPPPAVVIPAPTAVVLIPATYVYFVPDVSVDILFYRDHWYRPHHGRYYRAASYNGPWVLVAHGSVPRAVLHVPADFRRVPPGHRRIPHAELKKNWETWEKEKHWDKKAHVNTKEARGKADNKHGRGGGKGKQ